MQVNIRLLENKIVPEVLRFFNTAQNDKFQANNRSAEEFDWLFIKSFFKPAIYVVATESEYDEIIGTNAAIFIPMISNNGQHVMTVKGEDTLLSLDKMIGLGKRDILKELSEVIAEKSKDENVLFIWGFTPAKKAFQRCGFKIITQIKGSFYVTRPLKFYKNRIALFPQLKLNKKFQLFGFSWYNYLNNILKSTRSGGISFKSIGFDEVDEKVLLSFLPKNVYTTFLSKDFLKWRIQENPSPLKYGFLEFRDNQKQIVAYFIYSSNKENIFFVEQFLFHGQFPDHKKIRIIKLALNYCRKQKAVMVRALGLSHNLLNIKEMELLSRSGFHFFNNPEESYLIFKDLTDSNIKPEDIYLSRLNTQGIK